MLFEAECGKQIRLTLMNKCNLHTISLRLTGIFTRRCETNVFIFSGKQEKAQEVWVADMRANVPSSASALSLTAHFSQLQRRLGMIRCSLRASLPNDGYRRPCGASNRLPALTADRKPRYCLVGG